MSVYKDKKTNTWRVVYRCADWTGEMKQSSKRGFSTQREALQWENEMLNRKKGDTNMTFASFVELYTEDVRPAAAASSWAALKPMRRVQAATGEAELNGRVILPVPNPELK